MNPGLEQQYKCTHVNDNQETQHKCSSDVNFDVAVICFTCDSESSEPILKRNANGDTCFVPGTYDKIKEKVHCCFCQIFKHPNHEFFRLTEIQRNTELSELRTKLSEKVKVLAKKEDFEQHVKIYKKSRQEFVNAMEGSLARAKDSKSLKEFGRVSQKLREAMRDARNEQDSLKELLEGYIRRLHDFNNTITNIS